MAGPSGFMQIRHVKMTRGTEAVCSIMKNESWLDDSVKALMDASLLSFFPLLVYCLHALHFVLTLVQDVGRAHKVDGEDSRDWTRRDF